MKQRELKEAVEMFNYRIDILNPSTTRIFSRIHDGTVAVDEVYGGYKVYNGERMLEPIKEIILGLVKIYNDTPLEHREIMNGTRVLDHYRRKQQ
jgi:hypothetical protein|nr:MAG TPA: hypothetical protein [Caudoviricetes sp.]